ncbi:NAD(P)H-hydrate epimerase [Allopseudospirillum japonicum]|uniref:ADP-dependent (S)-NAD(P)H-hydrate dehydratase n=1 Tax=Allopseudospirillum japonicum TaxID=64971 RepID=A0A1H6QD90_9GAMM|nr:NAD(P)H-hydrate dehydratase [Allopseudospirillum japonicum]SEI41671.1 NAD(P)H-hydrate epimerase [Allopseudospirillum japonicum]
MQPLYIPLSQHKFTYGTQRLWPLVSAATSQALDRALIAQGYTSPLLMQYAADALWQYLQRLASVRQAQAPALLVLTGAGHNAGDGYLCAALAYQAGWPVQIISLVAPEKLQGEPQKSYQQAQALGIPIHLWPQVLSLELQQAHGQGDLYVLDALLGTGAQAPIQASWCDAIAYINQMSAYILAVDVPSGLDASTSALLGNECVRAQATLSLISVKAGLVTGQAPTYVGELALAPLVPAHALATAYTSLSFAQQADLLLAAGVWQQAPKARLAHAHKGHYGRVLIVGGDLGYGGAILLATQAALRAGAGWVRVLTRAEHMAPILTRTPEAMVLNADPQRLAQEIDQADVILLGPGLGQTAWGRALYQAAVQTWQQDSTKTWVLDADALNLYAQSPHQPLLPKTCVLTPHFGEGARLLNTSVAQIQADPYRAVQTIATQTQAFVVLKGAGSLIYHPQLARPWVCPWGNPGMASAGMGDTLAGLIAGLLAPPTKCTLSIQVQGQAIAYAVAIHALAADLAVKTWGETSMLAQDLIPEIAKLMQVKSPSQWDALWR